LFMFGSGIAALRGLVGSHEYASAEAQARSQAQQLATFMSVDAVGGVTGVPSGLTDWVVIRDDNRRLVSGSGSFAEFFLDGQVYLPRDLNPDHAATRTLSVQLGRLSGVDSPLNNRQVTLVSAAVQRPMPTSQRFRQDAIVDYAQQAGAALARGQAPPPVPPQDFETWPATTLTALFLVKPYDHDTAIATVDVALAVGLPVAVLFAALTAWIVTGRALRPVEAMRARLADITEHNIAERVPVPTNRDELADLARTTNATLDRLQAALETQRRFVADAAHELRTPIANLRNRLEVDLASPEVDWPSAARASLEQVTRLQALTDDLLLLARLDRVQSPPHRLVDVAALAEERIAERVAGAPAVSLHSRGPVLVRGDEKAMTRLIGNLVDNAARHATTAVRVTVNTTENQAVIEVADDGPGIPAHERERVFERFTRLDESRDRDQGGAGLGLAIVRDVATRHGGTATVADSKVGARVVVRVPLATIDHCGPLARLPVPPRP
jgi:signal transduction histidine kinase